MVTKSERNTYLVASRKADSYISYSAPNALLGGGFFNIFLCSPRKLGKISPNFGEHIFFFQKGLKLNHQPDTLYSGYLLGISYGISPFKGSFGG